MEICIKWNICRLCLQEEPKDAKNTAPMVNIFKESDVDKKIYECAGITVKLHDSLPEKICRRCLTNLRQTLLFRRTCRKSNEYLLSIIQRTKAASTFLKLDRQEKAASVSTELNTSRETYDYALSDEDTPISYESDTEKDEEQVTKRSHKQKRKRSKIDKTVEVSTSLSRFALKEEETQTLDTNCEAELPQYIVMRQDDNVVEHHEQHDISTDVDELDNNQHKVYEIEKPAPEILIEADDLGETKANEPLVKSNNGNNKQNNESNKMNDEVEVEVEAAAKLINQGNSQPENVEKNDGNDLYFILNDVDGHEQPPHQQQKQQQSNENESNEVPPIEYVCVDDDNNGDVEILEELDDNPQVSSTVLIKEEATAINVELDDESSNISYGTHDSNSIQYIVDEYIVHDTTDVNPSKSYSVLPTKRAQNSADAITLKNDTDVNKKHKSPLRRKEYDATLLPVGSTANGDSIFACYICNNQFTNRQLLKAHLKVHRQEKTHECELCFKRFITACNLQAHMRIHTGEKPFECQFCGRRFTDRSTHLRHERVHTNEKPFTCEQCGRSFTLATTLQAHKRTHTGERPYKCTPCSKSFKLAHQLKAHQNTHLHKAVEQSFS